MSGTKFIGPFLASVQQVDLSVTRLVLRMTASPWGLRGHLITLVWQTVKNLQVFNENFSGTDLRWFKICPVSRLKSVGRLSWPQCHWSSVFIFGTKPSKYFPSCILRCIRLTPAFPRFNFQSLHLVWLVMCTSRACVCNVYLTMVPGRVLPQTARSATQPPCCFLAQSEALVDGGWYAHLPTTFLLFWHTFQA